MKYIGEVFQDRRRDYLDIRNEYYHQQDSCCDIVMLGDSITEGFNINYCGTTNKVIINSGISGDRLRNLHARLEVDAVKLKPKQVVLMIGINDLLSDKPNTIDNYKANVFNLFEEYMKITESLVKHNIIPVCCGIIKTSQFEHNHMFMNQQIAYFNKLLEKYSNENEITYIDYNVVLGDVYGSIDDTFFSDGLHPNEKGYFEMFKLLKQHTII
ncbi:GDSL-type esterase/lipase family protein [Mollicutes bacterium LVI A0039]|nr:GDSL-type esterase/lipase family protein [Mollicutes bacterium LVI A0039]